jgi:hypothetical protein
MKPIISSIATLSANGEYHRTNVIMGLEQALALFDVFQRQVSKFNSLQFTGMSIALVKEMEGI